MVVQRARGVERAHCLINGGYAGARLTDVVGQDRGIGIVGAWAWMQGVHNAVPCMRPDVAEVLTPAEFENQLMPDGKWALLPQYFC